MAFSAPQRQVHGGAHERRDRVAERCEHRVVEFSELFVLFAPDEPDALLCRLCFGDERALDALQLRARRIARHALAGGGELCELIGRERDVAIHVGQETCEQVSLQRKLGD